MKTTQKQTKEELLQKFAFEIRGLSAEDLKKVKAFIEELKKEGAEVE